MRKANPRLVGGFIIGGLVITISVLIIFGSGIFAQKTRFVAFFPNSLQGLRVGAPVQLRGVQIGAVTEIDIRIDDKLNYVFPVVFEIDRDRVKHVAEFMEEKSVDFDWLIERGLRARLKAVSYVTGQQSIQLDFVPDSPVVLTDSDFPYAQIPTLPSEAEKIKGSLTDVVDQTRRLLAKLDQLFSDANQERIARLLSNADTAVAEVAKTIQTFGLAATTISETASVVKRDVVELRTMIESGKSTLDAYKDLAVTAKDVVTENRNNIQAAIKHSVEVEQKIIALASRLNVVVDENRTAINRFSGEGLVEIKNLTIDAQGAVEQFRRVMEEMERDPARFFLGKPGNIKE